MRVTHSTERASSNICVAIQDSRLKKEVNKKFIAKKNVRKKISSWRMLRSEKKGRCKMVGIGKQTHTTLSSIRSPLNCRFYCGEWKKMLLICMRSRKCHKINALIYWKSIFTFLAIASWEMFQGHLINVNYTTR